MAQTQAEHVNNNGESCPFCGNEDQLEGGPVTTGGGMSYQHMNCLMCERTWEDRYSISSYTATDE